MIIIKIILAVVLTILLIYLISTYIMFLLISKKFKKNPLSVINNAVEETLKPYKEITNKGNSWFEDKVSKKKVEDVYIKSKDNLKLHGVFIKNEKEKGILIGCHGYRSSAKSDLFASIFEYYNLGYSLLLIDQRTSNKSEGKYITFGIKESDDVIEWCKYINQRFKGVSIILGGISMGASSVLMAMQNIKEDMNVKAVIADCGYISAWDEVVYCIKHYFKLPGNLFINAIDLWCKIFAKFSLKEKNVLECIKTSNIPILLIHGEKDDFVKNENSKKIFDAYQGKKELLLVPKANHGLSYLVDGEKYISYIKKASDY